jgi:hypothetical protein
MTIRPTPFARWGAPLLLVAIGGVFSWTGVQNLPGGLAQTWAPFALGALAVAIGALSMSLYIQVDDSAIFTGTILTRRRYGRQDIARIRASQSPGTRLTFFVRSDGSEVLFTSGYLWGRERLSLLATYLGVPLDW